MVIAVGYLAMIASGKLWLAVLVVPASLMAGGDQGWSMVDGERQRWFMLFGGGQWWSMLQVCWQ